MRWWEDALTTPHPEIDDRGQGQNEHQHRRPRNHVNRILERYRQPAILHLSLLSHAVNDALDRGIILRYQDLIITVAMEACKAILSAWRMDGSVPTTGARRQMR